MKLYNYPGLNCYYNSIINIAKEINANYLNMLCGLWQETDLLFDNSLGVYFSQKITTNLKIAGIVIEKTDLDKIGFGEYFLIGADMMHLKWCLAYNSFSSPHYFIGKKSGGGVICFDPTYNKKNILQKHDVIAAYAFDISRIIKTGDGGLNGHKLISDAKEIINKHPQFLNGFISSIRAINQDKYILTAKYVNALISNRRLYKIYLQAKNKKLDFYGVFDEAYFSKWTQIKNGFYKAAAVKNRDSVINEICKNFSDLINAEILFANKILINAHM